jgi:hypothetical protein
VGQGDMKGQAQGAGQQPRVNRPRRRSAGRGFSCVQIREGIPVRGPPGVRVMTGAARPIPGGPAHCLGNRLQLLQTRLHRAAGSCPMRILNSAEVGGRRERSPAPVSGPQRPRRACGAGARGEAAVPRDSSLELVLHAHVDKAAAGSV